MDLTPWQTLLCQPRYRFVQDSLTHMRGVIDHYGGLNTVSLCFNGGKDCTVLLHLLAFLLRRDYPGVKLSTIPIVYFKVDNEFDELYQFNLDMMEFYGFELEEFDGHDMKQCLASMLNRFPSLKVIFMGQRRTDPHGGKLTLVQQSDTHNGWPAVDRANTILDWSYDQVWDFLIDFQLPYCRLYELGFTSLGSLGTTIPNPWLLKHKTFFTPVHPDHISHYLSTIPTNSPQFQPHIHHTNNTHNSNIITTLTTTTNNNNNNNIDPYPTLQQPTRELGLANVPCVECMQVTMATLSTPTNYQQSLTSCNDSLSFLTNQLTTYLQNTTTTPYQQQQHHTQQQSSQPSSTTLQRKSISVTKLPTPNRFNLFNHKFHLLNCGSSRPPQSQLPSAPQTPDALPPIITHPSSPLDSPQAIYDVSFQLAVNCADPKNNTILNSTRLNHHFNPISKVTTNTPPPPSTTTTMPQSPRDATTFTGHLCDQFAFAKPSYINGFPYNANSPTGVIIIRQQCSGTSNNNSNNNNNNKKNTTLGSDHTHTKLINDTSPSLQYPSLTQHTSSTHINPTTTINSINVSFSPQQQQPHQQLHPSLTSPPLTIPNTHSNPLLPRTLSSISSPIASSPAHTTRSLVLPSSTSSSPHHRNHHLVDNSNIHHDNNNNSFVEEDNPILTLTPTPTPLLYNVLSSPLSDDGFNGPLGTIHYDLITINLAFWPYLPAYILSNSQLERDGRLKPQPILPPLNSGGQHNQQHVCKTCGVKRQPYQDGSDLQNMDDMTTSTSNDHQTNNHTSTSLDSTQKDDPVSTTNGNTSALHEHHEITAPAQNSQAQTTPRLLLFSRL